MTQQEELNLYKKALVDWEQPIHYATEKGFLYYFNCEHGINIYYGAFEWTLPTLYSQLSFKKISESRESRVQALKNAIEILENELKQEG